jgi:hypothetical protein
VATTKKIVLIILLVVILIYTSGISTHKSTHTKPTTTIKPVAETFFAKFQKLSPTNPKNLTEFVGFTQANKSNSTSASVSVPYIKPVGVQNETFTYAVAKPPAPKPVIQNTPTYASQTTQSTGSSSNQVQIDLNNQARLNGYQQYQIVELDYIVRRESGFNIYAVNSSSGAGGLFQALPFSKTGCAMSNEMCQINWGLGYIQSRYGGIDNAYQHELNYGWY